MVPNMLTNEARAVSPKAPVAPIAPSPAPEAFVAFVSIPAMALMTTQDIARLLASSRNEVLSFRSCK
jgi:hypothetical protein